MSQTPGLIVIFGPTATGKTSLAIAVAKALGAPILSADSRQVYRGLDIGTAKPTIAEQQGVPHYLIDIADPDQNLTLATYQQQCQKLIDWFHNQDITPILVGGTGLYIKAIVLGMSIPTIPPQETLRRQLQALDQAQIYAMLSESDPQRAAQIHCHDRYRTIRALEIFYTTGTLPSQLLVNHPPSYPVWQLGLMPAPPELYKIQIGQRIQQMLDQGWLTEITNLQQRYSKELPILQTLGYKEMAQYLANQISLEQAIRDTTQRTLQLAKQQRTWFRSPENMLPNVQWLPSGTQSVTLLNLLHNLENGQIHANQDRSHNTTQNQDHKRLHDTG